MLVITYLVILAVETFLVVRVVQAGSAVVK
jgi:hypothetical protein